MYTWLMATIEKKIWPEFFDAVASGKKKFELRLNEFECKEGDTPLLREWDPAAKDYTGRQVEKKVGFVLAVNPSATFWSESDIKEKGLLILSLE